MGVARVVKSVTITFSRNRLFVRPTFRFFIYGTVVGGARVVSGAEKKTFDRGGPVWPPRSNAKYDGGFAPPIKYRGFWDVLGAAPPSQNFSKKNFPHNFFPRNFLVALTSSCFVHQCVRA